MLKKISFKKKTIKKCLKMSKKGLKKFKNSKYEFKES